MVKRPMTNGESPRRNGVAGRRLLLEELEQRRLLATASIDLVDEILEISGTSNDDMISIAYEHPADVLGNVVATVRKSSGALLVQETYDRMDIASLVVRAWGGRDGVTNMTNIPDIMEGGDGNDML